jgi:hypothetical protein
LTEEKIVWKKQCKEIGEDRVSNWLMLLPTPCRGTAAIDIWSFGVVLYSLSQAQWL